MLKLLKQLRRKEWMMAILCAVLVLGQIYFDLRLPDYMSNLTVLIKSPDSTMSDILQTGAEMLGCTLASAVLCVICGFLTAKVAAGFGASVRESVFNKIADFGQQEMMSFSVPSLINRTTNDITQIQMLVAMGLQILIKSPIMAVWAIIKIVNKSWDAFRHYGGLCSGAAGIDAFDYRHRCSPVQKGTETGRQNQLGCPGKPDRYQCRPCVQRRRVSE